LSQLYTPLEEIGRKIGDLQASLVSAERAFALLDQEVDPTDHSAGRAITRAQGNVAFQKVCFSYPNGPEVLHEICLEVVRGDRVGIMGPTGSGKTTLVSLLMRLYDPTRGAILLDGVDLRKIRLSDLRRQFSIVLQEPILFSTSVAENIAYGRPSATKEEIVIAARLANAHEFITRLPHGYETPVGERGMAISGGERQRIALARAFLRDAPILILDEPTSSVDLRTEASIVEALEQLMHGRTTFIIAHRVSTLRNCNVRLSFKDGRLGAWQQVAATIPMERETGVSASE
jgi:ATP-binding cassette subfamily B protein